jgi:hypothetical protein
LQPEPAPAPVQVPRADRTPSIAEDDTWQPEPPAPAPIPEVRPVRPADTLAGLAEELARPEQILPRGAHIQPPQVQPPIQVQPPRAQAPTPAPTISMPQATPAPSLAADQSLAEMAQRLEAALRRPMAQKVVAETQRVTATVEVKAGTPKPPVQPRGAAQSKPQSGNLEQEMANLLSRPGKT